MTWDDLGGLVNQMGQNAMAFASFQALMTKSPNYNEDAAPDGWSERRSRTGGANVRPWWWTDRGGEGICVLPNPINMYCIE